MLELLTRPSSDLSTIDGCCLDIPVWREELLPLVVSSILSLFRTKKASPRAVDEDNQSLVHYVASVIRLNYGQVDLVRSRADYRKSSPLLGLLQYLLINKAPANDYDALGRTPIGNLFSAESYSSITHPVPTACADLILRSNAEDALAHQSLPDSPLYSRLPNEYGKEDSASHIAVLLYFLSSSTEVARAYGCGPLGLAILTNNLEEVKLLVANHPSTLSERNLLGHTPLHLATDKPPILRVLVEAADTALINQRDGFDYSTLELAVSLSGLNCKGQKRQMCERCTCAECAVILLKADCAIPISPNLHLVLGWASKRCKLRYVHHMKDRRERLKQLGLDNLSTVDIDGLGLKSKHVLDYNACEVTRALQENHIHVPASLAITRDGSLSVPVPVYRELDSPDDANMFFRVGFRDTWAWCDPDTVELYKIPWLQNLWYLRWLANHEGISCQLPLTSTKDVFGCYSIFWNIGAYIWNERCSTWSQCEDSYSSRLPFEPCEIDSNIAWFHEIHAAVFGANIEDTCSCECSIGGCTMLRLLLMDLVNDSTFRYEPERFLQDHHQKVTDSQERTNSISSGFLEDSVINDNALLDLIANFITYLNSFSCHLQPRHHYATLRYITFTALGIHHSCCAGKYSWRIYEDPFCGVEARIEDDESHKLELLEHLLEEFKESITSILEDSSRGVRDLIYFWERTWVRRMSQVLDHLEGSDLPEDEKLAAEEIGVVWNKVGPEPLEPRAGKTGNPYQSNMIEHWLYELKKIEEECQ